VEAVASNSFDDWWKLRTVGFAGVKEENEITPS
jgi:hypothetical protein